MTVIPTILLPEEAKSWTPRLRFTKKTTAKFRRHEGI
jgi:hypothetical protein